MEVSFYIVYHCPKVDIYLLSFQQQLPNPHVVLRVIFDWPQITYPN